MKTIKIIGYAGIASAALALIVPSMTITEAAQARTSSEQSAVSTVHRVSHALASESEYTASSFSGYKWGQVTHVVKSDMSWSGSAAPESGYKWGKSSYSEQSANPWGRKDFSEQSANPWGRKDFSEQSANPWGRKDFSEQTANPWGRK